MSDLQSADVPVHEPPTHARHTVRWLLCLLAGVLYLDRVCMSSALDPIQRELKLTNTQSSYVLMAFTLAYGLFEVPTGRWGDRHGGRRVLTRVCLWWSTFTALTGACTSLWPLVGVRFLFGAGEAGALPNAARVIARWFPSEERGRAQGAMLASSLVGGAVSPFVAAVMIQSVGWRWTFATFGAVGTLWAGAWWWWFRDDPAAHSAVNAGELERIGRGPAPAGAHAAIPWSAVVRNPSVRQLGMAAALASFNTYIYFSWFPKYLKEARKIGLTEAGLMGSVVLALAAVGTLAGGAALDRVVSRGGGLVWRRRLGSAGFFAAAVFLLGALAAPGAWPAALLTAASCFAAQTTQPLWWATATEVSGRHVGALSGLMNSMGVLGALTSQYLVGALADALAARGHAGRAQWDPVFYIDVAVLACAGLIWYRFRWEPVDAGS